MKARRVSLPILTLVCTVTLLECSALLTRHESSRVRIRELLPKSFGNVRINSHKEKELRIGFDRTIAIETSLRNVDVQDYSITIRQVTDGKRLVQSVLQNGVIKECDFTKDLAQIKDFINNFVESSDFNQGEFGDVITAYNDENNVNDVNVTLANTYFSSTNTPTVFTEFLDIRSQRQRCRDFSKMAKATARREARLLRHGEYYDSLDAKTKIFLEAVKARQKELAYIDGIPIEGDNPVRGIKKRSRSKRATFDFNSVLIFPGTKWCGKGDLATCFEDLGDDKELDVCCRDHDCCPYVIPPFSRKFGVFNYRFHSLLHCECDQRFRGCLRESPSSTANMIGKIYFNILGSKCFDFHETEVCVSRAWYGYCRKYEKQVTAIVKSQQAFYDECVSINGTTTTPPNSGSGSSSAPGNILDDNNAS